MMHMSASVLVLVAGLRGKTKTILPPYEIQTEVEVGGILAVEIETIEIDEETADG